MYPRIRTHFRIIAGVTGIICALCCAHAYEESYNLAVERFRAGDFSAALPHLKEVIKARKDMADAHRLMGHCLFRLERYDAAAAAFERALAAGAGSADIFSCLAEVHVRRGQKEEAITQIRKAIEAGSEEPMLQLAMADLLNNLDRVGEAEAVLKSVDGPPDVRALAAARLGNIYLEQDRKRDALTAYLTAYYSGMATPEIQTAIAELYLDTGDVDEAVAVYERMIKANRDIGDKTYLRLAQLYYAAEETDSARDMARPLTRSQVGTVAADASRVLARIAFDAGALKNATALREKSSQSHDDPALAAAIGGAWYNRSKFKMAAAILDRALVHERPDAEVLNRIIACHLELGDTTEARRYLNRYVEHIGMDAHARAHISELVPRRKE